MTADFVRTLDDESGGFSPFMEAIEAHLKKHDVPEVSIARLMVALDEVISNIRSHGGAEGRGPRIDVRICVSDRAVEAEIRDDGIAFDPLELEAPDTSLSIDQREVGGLGIHLVRELMDEVGHEQRDGANVLRLRLKFHCP